jgi:hypothetical protein
MNSTPKRWAGRSGVAPVKGHGARYIVILPELNPEYEEAWNALNRRYGIAPASTRDFITTAGELT